MDADTFLARVLEFARYLNDERAQRNARARERYHARLAQGLCPKCEERPAPMYFNHCAECRFRHRRSGWKARRGLCQA